MQIKREMILREIAGESFLVPVDSIEGAVNGLFIMTETAGFIWKALPEAENEEDIVDRLLAEYDVEREVALADVREILEYFRSYKIID